MEEEAGEIRGVNCRDVNTLNGSIGAWLWCSTRAKAAKATSPTAACLVWCTSHESAALRAAAAVAGALDLPTA